MLEMDLIGHYILFQKMDIWIVNYFMRSSIDYSQTKRIPGLKLLALDVHDSHLTIDAINLCHENNVH